MGEEKIMNIEITDVTQTNIDFFLRNKTIIVLKIKETEIV